MGKVGLTERKVKYEVLGILNEERILQYDIKRRQRRSCRSK
jgi:hypothetical protein